MRGIPTKSSLSAPRKRLLEDLQRTNFGRVEVRIHRGEPVVEPPPRIVQDIKLGGGMNGPRSELAWEDFVLKDQVIEMFEQLSHLADGSMAVVHVAHGLPCRLTVEQPA